MESERPTNRLKVLVTGATGAVGPRIVNALMEAGYGIRILALDPLPDGVLPADVEVHIGDVTNPSAIQAVMSGVETVIHMAGLLHIMNPPPSLREKYERVNVGGTANVIECAVQCDVKRVVFFSTVGVYGYNSGKVVTEETKPHPNTFYAETKLAAERIVLEARSLDGQPIGTVLRLAAVYGPRIKGNYRRLLLALAHDRFVPIGDGRNRRTLIYDKDVARAALLVMQHPSAAGQVYNVSDGEFHTLNEIIKEICASLHRTPPHFPLPIRPVRFVAGLLEDAARLVGRQSPIGRATVDKYTEDVAIESRRIQSQLGFHPRFNLEEGWRETVNEMRLNGEL